MSRYPQALLHPHDIIDILIEEHGFRAVRPPRLAGPVYLAEGIDRRGNNVRVVLDSGNGRLLERELLARRRSESRLAHARPFADRASPAPAAPDSAPVPPRRPPGLTGARPATLPIPAPPQAAAGASQPGSRPRIADPRPLGEPDQPPPFARGATPAVPPPGATP